MNKVIYTLIFFLSIPLMMHAQYSGGTGRGSFTLALNSTFLSNAFVVSGNWNVPSNWSDGVMPSSSENAYVNADATAGQDYSYPALVIAPSGSFTLAAGAKLTVSGDITNMAGSGGLVLESAAGSNSSLLNATAGVNGTVRRIIEKDGHWHFLSCPINQAPMPEICDGNFAPLTSGFDMATGQTYDFFFWQEPPAASDLNWINLKKADWSVNTARFGDPPRFSAGKGYLVQYSNLFAGDPEKSVAGILGNGIINIPVTKTTGGNTYNLIGNPYPCYIDWKAPSGWTRTVLEDDGGGKNVWIWNGTTGNYGAYNSASLTDLGTNGVSRYIAMQQGFFVKAATSGTVTVTNDIRCQSDRPWLKSADNCLTLRVSSEVNEYSDEVLVEFGHTLAGGAEKWFSMYPESPSLFLPVAGDLFSVRFLGNASENPSLPLSFKAGQDGTYYVSATGSESFQNVFLQDMKTGNIQDLKTAPVYTFTANGSDEPERFFINFRPVGEATHTACEPAIYFSSGNLTIVNPGESRITFYNMLGQKLNEFQAAGGSFFRVRLDLPAGYYVVKLTTDDKAIAKKIYVDPTGH